MRVGDPSSISGQAQWRPTSGPHIVSLARSPYSAQPSEHCLGEMPLPQILITVLHPPPRNQPYLSKSNPSSKAPKTNSLPSSHPSSAFPRGWWDHALWKHGSNRRKRTPSVERQGCLLLQVNMLLLILSPLENFQMVAEHLGSFYSNQRNLRHIQYQESRKDQKRWLPCWPLPLWV